MWCSPDPHGLPLLIATASGHSNVGGRAGRYDRMSSACSFPSASQELQCHRLCVPALGMLASRKLPVLATAQAIISLMIAMLPGLRVLGRPSLPAAAGSCAMWTSDLCPPWVKPMWS